MANHVHNRRRTRRQMAWAALGALIGLCVAALVGAFTGHSEAIEQVDGILMAGLPVLGGIVGWYMKLGSDENKHSLEFDDVGPSGK